MKVTLRQARRIEREIGAKIESLITRDIHNHGGFSVTVYEDLRAKVQEVQKSTLEEAASILELTRIRFAIRKAIETSNETSGLNSLMNREASLKTVTKYLTAKMVGELSQQDLDIAVNRHAALKAQVEGGTAPQNRYSGETTDALTIAQTLTAETLDHLRAEAKNIQRELLAIVERQLAINATASFEVPDEDVKLLEKNDIVV